MGELIQDKINKNGYFYFSWDNYKYGKDHDKLTKYCNDPRYGLNKFTDNLTELLPEDDAAYQFKKCHNFKFHMPTKELCEELIKYTSNYWVNNYNPNKTIHNLEDDGGIFGLNGRIFEGKNGNLLFIPAAGYCTTFELEHSYCYLWTSSLSLRHPNSAYYMYFSLRNINIQSYEQRCCGFTIRPVVNL